MFYYTIAALKFATTMPFRETESGFYEIIRYLKSVVALAKFATWWPRKAELAFGYKTGAT
jgi:hypothetical protein